LFSSEFFSSGRFGFGRFSNTRPNCVLLFSVNNLTILARPPSAIAAELRPATCRRALAKADDQTNVDHAVSFLSRRADPQLGYLSVPKI